MEREQLDRVVARAAPVVVAQRGLEEPEEAVDRTGAAVGGEVLATEPHERVGVLAPFLGELVGVGDEVGEVLAERPAGRRPCASPAAHRARAAPRDGRGTACRRARASGCPAGERLLERRRLRVDAVEHRELRPAQAAAVGGLHRTRDALRLGLVVVVVDDGGDRAVGLGGVHRRAPATGRAEHRVGGGDHLRRRPVVAPQADDADRGVPVAREVHLEPGEVLRVGAREAVDRLVAVADDAQVGPVAEPRAQEPELRGAGVLELVDVEVAEAPSLRVGERGVLLERVRAPTMRSSKSTRPRLRFSRS